MMMPNLQEGRDHKLYFLLRKHRVPVEVAASTMKWERGYPLDRLMCEAADTLEEVESLCDHLIEEEEENLSQKAMTKIAVIKDKL